MRSDWKERWHCQNCGTSIEYNESGKQRYYCSNKCRQAAYRVRNTLYHHDWANCKNCGREFGRNTTAQKYCGNACKQAYYRRSKERAG